MRKMKDSGVAWLGEIPEDWTVIFNKHLMKKVKCIREKYTGEDVLSLTMKGVLIRDLDNPSGKMPATFDGYQFVEAGNLLMCLFDIDVTPRCIGLIKNNGVCSPAYSQFKLNDLADAGYYYYYYLNLDNTKELLHLAKNLRHSLTEEQFGAIPTALPPLDVQKKISHKLERKVSEADALITNVQAQIEKLKTYKQSLITEVVTKGLDPNVPMKDSGVEWIGKIPKHWNMIRFRFIAKITTGNQDTQNADPDGMYPFYVRSPIVERCNNYTFEGKGILMAGDGAGAGRVFHLVNGKYAVHQRVYRFYDFKYMNPVLLKFYLENLFATVMDYGSAKTTVPSVRLPMIQDFPVCVPPEDEQLKMLEILSEKTNKIDRFIAVKQTKIEKLEQYKRSLIYEYVTGKKEVS